MSDVALVNYRHTGIDQCVYSAYTELDSAIECSLLPLTECCCICVPFGVVQVPKSGLLMLSMLSVKCSSLRRYVLCNG
jgi:hypothetical protein